MREKTDTVRKKAETVMIPRISVDFQLGAELLQELRSTTPSVPVVTFLERLEHSNCSKYASEYFSTF